MWEVYRAVVAENIGCAAVFTAPPQESERVGSQGETTVLFCGLAAVDRIQVVRQTAATVLGIQGSSDRCDETCWGTLRDKDEAEPDRQVITVCGPQPNPAQPGTLSWTRLE